MPLLHLYLFIEHVFFILDILNTEFGVLLVLLLFLELFVITKAKILLAVVSQNGVTYVLR